MSFVGLKIRGIDEKVLELLEEVEIYYPYAMILEPMEVVIKITKRKS